MMNSHKLLRRQISLFHGKLEALFKQHEKVTISQHRICRFDSTMDVHAAAALIREFREITAFVLEESPDEELQSIFAKGPAPLKFEIDSINLVSELFKKVFSAGLFYYRRWKAVSDYLFAMHETTRIASNLIERRQFFRNLDTTLNEIAENE